MIITKLHGGLGNQMFQYATGRSLANRLDVELKIDISGFKDCTLRRYELDCFNIKAALATSAEKAVLARKKPTLFERAARKFLNQTIKSTPTHIFEKSFFFDRSIFDLPNNVYLEGYWQSWKYFDDINNIIRKEFTLKEKLTDQNEKTAKTVSSVQSVSLHIRRGDYVADPRTTSYHGICDMEYYNRCIKYIEKQIGNPHFFIFSDEPEWAAKNFRIDRPFTIVSNSGTGSAYEDMILMSTCKHNIIANSSFSWWAAWLNKNPNKIVLSPARWFNKAEYDTSDLIPIGWKRI